MYSEEKMQKYLLKMYIGEMRGLKEIGKIINKDPRTIRPFFLSLGLDIPYPGSVWTKVKKHLNKEFTKPFSQHEEEYINGMLLGDAQLRLQTKHLPHDKQPELQEYLSLLHLAEELQKKVLNEDRVCKKDLTMWNHIVKRISKVNTANLRVHKSILEFQWVKTLIAHFSSFTNLTPFVRVNHSKSVKWSCGFDTASSVEFFSYWKKWYSTKSGKLKKVLYEDFKLTPNVLLMWYVDDGYYSKTDLTLCTHNFDIREQEFLINALLKVGIKAKLRRKGKYFQIGVSTSRGNKNNFFNYIQQATLYNKACDIFPYKFSSSLTKNEWKNEMKEKFPAFFSLTKENRELILKNLKKNGLKSF